GWVNGDLIQIYMKSAEAGDYVYVRNMRFYYDPEDYITHLGGLLLEAK
ncbi:unnamed protein product, partial [marine sediment metagenome]